MSVNVEEIMSGIRAEIQEKGYSSDMLSFADVPADADAGIYVERFDADMLRGNVQYISEHHRVDPYRPLAGNPVAVFFKKVLRNFFHMNSLIKFDYRTHDHVGKRRNNARHN